MIMNVGVFLHDFRQKAFVDVARGEICLSVITGFVGIVKLKFERLRHLVVCKVSVGTKERTRMKTRTDPRCFQLDIAVSTMKMNLNKTLGHAHQI